MKVKLSEFIVVTRMLPDLIKSTKLKSKRLIRKDYGRQNRI